MLFRVVEKHARDSGTSPKQARDTELRCGYAAEKRSDGVLTPQRVGGARHTNVQAWALPTPRRRCNHRVVDEAVGTEAMQRNSRGPRWVWLAWTAVMVGLATTLWLAALSGEVASAPWFLLIAIASTMGYTTVGAVLASRNPRNPIGPLMMMVGAAFIFGSLGGRYLTYAVVTRPGSLPLGPLVGIVGNQLWLVTFAGLVMLAVLFPTGTVPSSRWRLFPGTIVATVIVGSVASLLIPGPWGGEELGLPEGVTVESPLGVEALRAVAPVVAGAGWVIVLASVIPAVASLVLRYRRALGEERQQIRWLAYVAGTFLSVLVLGLVGGLITGDSYDDTFLGDVFPLLGFTLAGIGVPVAIGIAVLRFRLYDLELVIKKTVVFGIVVVLLLVLASVAALLVGGSVLDRSGDAAPLIVGAIVGLSVLPLYRLATVLADRVVYGGRASPYEVLTEFSDRVAEAYSAEDVLPRTAAVLGAGIGAEMVRVWLRVGDHLRSIASWPSDVPLAEPVRISEHALPSAPGEDVFEVRHQGELLGAISVTMRANDPMNPSKRRLIRDLASQEGLVLRNVRLIEELRESRRRIVTAQDERAKALERNIHDGAQQQLVALAVKLRLLEQMAERDPAKAAAMAAELQAQANDMLGDLRDLARGIYPPLLADKGLVVALEAQTRKASVPIGVVSDGVGRYPQDVEAAVYFSCLEALQNVAKYADASVATVHLSADDGRLDFEVGDDGRGFDTGFIGYGTGLQGIADRLAALGGSLSIDSSPDAGTRVRGSIPIA